MAVTQAPGRIPVSEYLRGGFEPDAEYVDGRIEERPVGEFDHAAWQAAILSWFTQHAAAWAVFALPELRVQVAPVRFRVPDVTVLDRGQPKEQIITHAPLAVFEVLSPEDRVQRMTHKLSDYAAMGIAQIWVVDPEGPVYYRFQAGELRRAEEFCLPGGPMRFQMREIAALLPGGD